MAGDAEKPKRPGLLRTVWDIARAASEDSDDFYTRKQEWRLGEEGWEVLWCVDNRSVNERDWKWKFRNCHTRQEALACARAALPEAKLGYVEITPFIVDPMSDLPPDQSGIEYTGDGEFFRGD